MKFCINQKEIDYLHFVYREEDRQMMDIPFFAANTVNILFTVFSLIPKFFLFIDPSIASTKERNSIKYIFFVYCSNTIK